MRIPRPIALLAASAVFALASTAGAQDPDSDSWTFFPHPDNGPLYIAVQVNLIEQAHGSFPALYSGTNSLKSAPESALSRVLTLYTGIRAGRGWEVLFDVESA